MCGRFALLYDHGFYGDFRILDDDLPAKPEIKSNYNAAPGQNLPVITQNEKGNTIQLMRWGMVPHWAKDPKIGYSLINAKAETLAEKPTWKHPFKRQRCIVPASGFIEWKREGNCKTPYFIKLADREYFAFAGLYDIWKDAEGYEHKSFSIVTTEPNEAVSAIHNRMPVILTPEQEDVWLSQEANEQLDLLGDLLNQKPQHQMDIYPISSEVNNAKNNKAELLQKIA